MAPKQDNDLDEMFEVLQRILMDCENIWGFAVSALKTNRGCLYRTASGLFWFLAVIRASVHHPHFDEPQSGQVKQPSW